jgi:drug/metabolite transporter (DMT)-like permease
VSRLSPALLAFIAIFVLSVMDAMIKGASAQFGTLQVVLLRFAMGALVMTGLFAVLFPGWPSWEAIRVNGLRGFLVVFTAISFFYALAVLPLAEVLALSFLSPIFIATLGVVLLKEHASRQTLFGLLLGTLGMLVMVFGMKDDSELDRPMLGIAAAIASAFSYSLAIVLLRARALKDPVVTIVFIQHLVPSIIVTVLVLIVVYLVTPGMAAIPHVLTFKALGMQDLLWFLGIGLCGAIGHFVLASAFARAEAAKLAPMDYTSLIWAVLFGFLFFSEVPELLTLAGSALIAFGAWVAGRGREAPVEQS